MNNTVLWQLALENEISFLSRSGLSLFIEEGCMLELFESDGTFFRPDLSRRLQLDRLSQGGKERGST